MTPELVREIADQIIRQEILQNWKLYGVLFALGLIGAVAGNWLSSYSKKRAETYATKADLQEVLRQIQATTRATEEVKAAVSHADWIAREWRTTRRTKLEELLSAARALDRWLDSEQNKWIHAEPTLNSEAPLDRLEVLSTLYFPELRGEVLQVSSSHNQARSTILEIAPKVREAQGDAVAYQAAMNEYVESWKNVYPPTLQAIRALEDRAGRLMHEISGA